MGNGMVALDNNVTCSMAEKVLFPCSFPISLCILGHLLSSFFKATPSVP